MGAQNLSVMANTVTFAGETFVLQFHSVLGQVILIGLVMFCEPGIYNALMSMAGGIDNLELVATSNGIEQNLVASMQL
eukprot:SAG11_NODE_5523_length_1536_cov_1.781489_2_plen_78_part_00